MCVPAAPSPGVAQPRAAIYCPPLLRHGCARLCPRACSAALAALLRLRCGLVSQHLCPHEASAQMRTGGVAEVRTALPVHVSLCLPCALVAGRLARPLARDETRCGCSGGWKWRHCHVRAASASGAARCFGQGGGSGTWGAVASAGHLYTCYMKLSLHASALMLAVRLLAATYLSSRGAPCCHKKKHKRKLTKRCTLAAGLACMCVLQA
jgi:hypothetical protein